MQNNFVLLLLVLIMAFRVQAEECNIVTHREVNINTFTERDLDSTIEEAIKNAEIKALEACQHGKSDETHHCRILKNTKVKANPRDLGFPTWWADGIAIEFKEVRASKTQICISIMKCQNLWLNKPYSHEAQLKKIKTLMSLNKCHD